MPCLPEFYYSAEIQEIQELAWSNRVRLVWVLGQCGIHGNEEADAHARAVTSSAFVGPEPCLPFAPSSAKRREREWLLKSHCSSWSMETACRQTRMWLKKPNPGLTRYLLRLPRSKLRDFGGTHNWTLSIKQVSAQRGSYRRAYLHRFMAHF
jgi:hypothetical protein